MADIDCDIYDEVVEVAHPFEIEINILVKVNHSLTLVGIAKQEEVEIARTEEIFDTEDRDIVDSQIRWQRNFYAELRQAANHLALVGLVTRLDHWIAGFMRLKQLRVFGLSKNLRVLNQALDDSGPVPVQVLEELVTIRDSVIHGDSKAEWEFKGTRKVAPHYRSGSLLQISEDQLTEAIEKVVKQVKWYDEMLHPLGARIPRL